METLYLLTESKLQELLRQQRDICALSSYNDVKMSKSKPPPLPAPLQIPDEADIDQANENDEGEFESGAKWLRDKILSQL